MTFICVPVKRAVTSRFMKHQPDVETATCGGLDPLPFGVALGHRLRQVREQQGMTAAELAAWSRHYGLGWDRSTVARIELGQRQVNAGELMVMTLLYGEPLRSLLPTESVRLNELVTASPAGLVEALVKDNPGTAEWQVEGLAKMVMTQLVKMAPTANAVMARLPGAGARTIAAAAKHVRDETTVKASKRLDATSEEVAVAAEYLWKRGIAGERDARVNAMGSTDARTRQARRGHVTRVLLAELAPAILTVRTGEREPGSGLTATVLQEEDDHVQR